MWCHNLCLVISCAKSAAAGKEFVFAWHNNSEHEYVPGGMRVRRQTVPSPLSHLASGSWIWRSGPKTSSTVTFFFRARLSSSPVKIKTMDINKRNVGCSRSHVAKPQRDANLSGSLAVSEQKNGENFFHQRAALLRVLHCWTRDHHCVTTYITSRTIYSRIKTREWPLVLRYWSESLQ